MLNKVNHLTNSFLINYKNIYKYSIAIESKPFPFNWPFVEHNTSIYSFYVITSNTIPIILYFVSNSLPLSTKQYIFTKYITFGIVSKSYGIFYYNYSKIDVNTPFSIKLSINYGTSYLIY